MRAYTGSETVNTRNTSHIHVVQNQFRVKNNKATLNNKNQSKVNSSNQISTKQVKTQKPDKTQIASRTSQKATEYVD